MSDKITLNIVKDPNCSPKILRKVLNDKNNTFPHIISYYAAINPNCPVKILSAILKHNKNRLISYYAAQNIHYPTKLLVKIIKTYNNYDNVIQGALVNPKCPVEILRKILATGKSNKMTSHAAGNPNCPADVLSAVLARGKDNWVSREAAKNLNCPANVLREVLERNRDDYVSYYAARNSNCPVDILLKRFASLVVSYRSYKKNIVICGILSNPHCPQEILVRVLEENNIFNNNILSSIASNNRNCPPQIRLKWLQAVGRIKMPDLSKHDVQVIKDNNKPDEAWEQFKKMVEDE